MNVSGARFIIFLVCLTVLERVFCARKNELNVSKGDPLPMLFWPIQTSKHNKTITTGKMLAILHDVELVSGPTTNAGILDALSFNGMPTSYVKIQNINGILNGDNALNWMFYVYISYSIQTASLLEYHNGGTVAGFTLGISNQKLTASFYDQLGLSYNIQSTFSIPVSIWTFVGVNFNKLWSNDQFDLFMIDAAGSLISETTGLGAASSVLIQALGSVVIGSNHLGNQNFEGKIACIQFSNKSQIHGPQKNAPDVCDPNLWTDPEYDR
ncbi:uncharacterized protein LOC110449217 [Mizuhopecten yessoensis]|uniref:uncharacterized protein LOC110449217 n=1 Tax=Mizuhopecten yessoensis TaxID=6573 RepID=UPI000B457E31|nr:uncharacterized protein LOC110449217 [Mizuhopecten yessoensis]